MVSVRRRSPVVLPGEAAESAQVDGWEVVLRYEGESELSPVVVDLSHKPRWMVQGSDLQEILGDLSGIPSTPGEAHWEKGWLVGRLGFRQAIVWVLGESDFLETRGSGFTDVTDGTILLGIGGPAAFAMGEKLTALNLLRKDREAPFVLQGPFSHVPCTLAVLKTWENSGAFLVACSRGYAQDMVHAVMDAGGEWGLRPGGEKAFHRFLG